MSGALRVLAPETRIELKGIRVRQIKILREKPGVYQVDLCKRRRNWTAIVLPDGRMFNVGPGHVFDSLLHTHGRPFPISRVMIRQPNPRLSPSQRWDWLVG